MKLYSYLLIIFTFFLITTQIALPKVKEPIYYLGAYGGYNINFHSADFKELPGYPNCCNHFTSGTGNGLAFGGLFEYVLVPEVLLGARLGFSSISGDLTKQETIGNTRVLRGGNIFIEDILVDQKIESSVYTIGIEPEVIFKFFDFLASSVGFRASYMLKSKFNQGEYLKYPADVTFLDERRVQNDFYGEEIPEKNAFQFHGLVSISAELPLGPRLFIYPEMRYYIPFMDISSVTWKISTLQLGVAVKMPFYKSTEKPRIYETEYKRDTTITRSFDIKEERFSKIFEDSETSEEETNSAVVVRTIIKESYLKELPGKSKLEASVDAVGIAEDGSRQKDPTIIIEELETEEGFPLLPHVFFKEGSAELGSTDMHLLTREETASFIEDSLEWGTMQIYSDLLNIIGYRMNRLPGTALTVTGCNNNLSHEMNNLALSESRAAAVRDYLVNVWSIQPDRINTKAQGLPDNPANNLISDGQIENQRAELSSNSFELLKPVFLKSVAKKITPPTIEIIPVIKSESELKDWKISVEQENQMLRTYSGTANPDNIIWEVFKDPLPALEAPVSIKLSAEDIHGQEAEASKLLSIKQLTLRKKRYELREDKRIERYSLIVFDFDKADIKPHHRQILEQIKSKIMPDSYVIIEGYADRTGEREYNRELAGRRIAETMKILGVPESNLRTKPVGSDILLYDNNLPQGRSYSRTVKITIETPVTESGK